MLAIEILIYKTMARRFDCDRKFSDPRVAGESRAFFAESPPQRVGTDPEQIFHDKRRDGLPHVAPHPDEHSAVGV